MSLLQLVRRGGRALAAVGVLASVGLVLAATAIHAVREDSVAEMSCWLLPKGQVMAHPVGGSCPLRILETIRLVESGGEALPVEDADGVRALLETAGDSVRVAVRREGREVWVEVPVSRSTRPARIARVAVSTIAIGLLLSIPLFLLWRSASSAAVPLTLFYGAVSLVLTAMLAGQHSPILTRAAVGALILAPAALTHLAFTFPRERPILLEIPNLVAIPYFVAAALVPIGWVALERDPLLGPAFLALLLVLAGGAWFVLLFACGLALRESDSAIERARARVVFFGALAAPLLPTLVAVPIAGSSARTGIFYLWSAAAVMPLPIALAISRYNLFDLGWDVRHAVVRGVYLGLAALVVSLVLVVANAIVGSPGFLLEAAPLYLMSFLCVTLIEPLRTRMPGLLETMMAPRLRRLREAREWFEQEVTRLQHEDGICRSAAKALEKGIGSCTGCVLLCTFGEWRPAHPFGDGAPSWTGLLEEALATLEEASIVHLPAEPEREAAAPGLKLSRIEVVCAIESGGERYGVLLVGNARKRAPLTGMELEFVTNIAAHAAIALRNAQITLEMLAAERHATTGRLAVGLAHDLGKDLGWIRRLARRLPELGDDEARLQRDASMIRELSDGLAQAVKRFVDDSTQPIPSHNSERFDQIVHRAIERVSRVHGQGRITKVIDPDLDPLPFHEHLERVLGNLLDNALHASPLDATVHLFGTLEDDSARITIEDRGSGIPASLLGHIFEAGVSTRRGAGGSGVGLTVAREIVQSLGGTLTLDPGSERGTRASLHIPIRKESP